MSAEGELFLAGFIILLIVIVMPIVIAFARRHPNRWLILILVFAAGATVIGWLIALVWSLHGFHRSEGPVRNGGESGLNFDGNDGVDDHVWDAGEPENDDGPATGGRRGEPVDGRLLSIEEAARQLEHLAALKASGSIDESEHAELRTRTLRRIR